MPNVEQSQTPSDEEIVALVRAGDTARFETIMRRHNQRLFRVTRAILRNDADAEDAMQQAYLSAYAHLDQFSGDAKFATWLTRIAMNEAYTRARRRARLGEVDIAEEGGEGAAAMSSVDETRSPEDHASGQQLAELLEASIDELPELYRIVIVMREVQDLSTAETAACLELTEEAVRVRLHRGKKLLRESMGSRMQSDAPAAFAFLGPRCDRVVAAVMARLSPAERR